MALELSAAIIGILAAAGKVAETLGPFVSAFVDAPKHCHAIFTEVRHTGTILSSLETLFNELDAIPQRRKQLIQVEQLVTTLTDGVTLFSELEALVDKLGDPKDKLASRANWARKDQELESMVTKLHGFKTSVALMLDIIQCESDLVARTDRQMLLDHTASILKHNAELSQRLAHLESYFDATHTITSNRTVSIISSNPVLGNSTADEHTPRASRASFLFGDTARDWQFEAVLTASRVYRKVRRDSEKYSFCSSIPLSHAWTTLSELSLSDISVISVIALPLQRTDIYNADRYEFTDWPLGPDEDNLSQHSGSSGSTRTVTQAHFREDVISIGLPPAHEAPQPPVRIGNHLDKLRCIVIGTLEADVNHLVAMFTSPPYMPGDARNPVNVYEKSCKVDDHDVHLSVEAVSAFPDEFNAGMHAERFTNGDIFMFVYKSTSRASFDGIVNLLPTVQQYKDDPETQSIMIVGVHDDDSNVRAVRPSQGRELARDYTASFCEIIDGQMETLHVAVSQMVRWIWLSTPQRSTDVRKIAHVAPMSRRLNFSKRQSM